MRVLVTGGSGFIGSHLVDRLRARGIHVRIFDMIIPTYRNDVEFYHGSIMDLEALKMAMNDINVVYHLAAIADVKDVYENPYHAETINVRGTLNVLEAARKSTIDRLIYGSTTWVYSEVEEISIDEQTPLRAPNHFYTVTKIASEFYCHSYSKLFHLPVTILRYGIPYGPRSRDRAVISAFVKKALNGEPLTIEGDGLQFRKFVYVEDLAEGNVLALKPIAKNKTYNLDGNEKVSIAQITQLIQKMIGNVKIVYAPFRPGDFSGKEISSKLARDELGWTPQVGFEEGLSRYINWFRLREANRQKEGGSFDSFLKEEGAETKGAVEA